MFRHVVKDVEMAIFTAAVHGIVRYHTHHLRLLTTYGALADTLDKPPAGAQLAHALRYITEHEHKQGIVPCSIGVVNSHTCIPGAGLFNQLRELGHKIGDEPDDERQYWLGMLAKLGIAPFTLEMLVQEDGTIRIPREFVMGPQGPKVSGNYETEIIRRARENARPTNIKPAPSQAEPVPEVIVKAKDMAGLKRELERARRDPDYVAIVNPAPSEQHVNPIDAELARGPGSRLPGDR